MKRIVIVDPNVPEYAMMSVSPEHRGVILVISVPFSHYNLLLYTSEYDSNMIVRLIGQQLVIDDDIPSLRCESFLSIMVEKSGFSS